MSFKRIALLAALGIVVVVAAVSAWLHYQDALEKRSAYQAAVDEGFVLIEGSSAGGAEEAIGHALDARRIDHQGKEAMLLLAQAYFIKGMYNESIQVLKEGLNDLEDADYYPEFNYHIALAYAGLYNDLQGEQHWKLARDYFSEAATVGKHRADAYFGLGSLYFPLFKESLTPSSKEKVVSHFRRCLDLESEMEGYQEGIPGSPCPYCRLAFQRKSDQEAFMDLMEKLSGK